MGEAETRLHALQCWMEKVITAPVPVTVHQLAETVRWRHGDSVTAVLMYGSCLRSGDPFDGLVDLYVIVDDYNKAYERRWLAWANGLLPPNVFYLDRLYESQTVRTKYAVISRDDFVQGMSRWFHSYLWGRFSQPCRLVYQREEGTKAWVARALVDAGVRLVTVTVPMLPVCFSTAMLWKTGLCLSYSAELRAEKGEERAQELVDHDAEFYRHMTPSLLASLPQPPSVKGEDLFCLECSSLSRIGAQLEWLVRRIQGKLLSLLRLIKSLFTFQGGVEYILWKLERHTGQHIDLPPHVKRYPLIFGWGVLWRLYRQGVFR